MTRMRQRQARRRPSREDRRQELLDAAVRVVRRSGPAASMDEIAAEAGITKPILYRHFGDRTGLVDAVAARFAQDLTERIGEALAAQRDAPAILVSAVDAYLEFVERDPHVLRFLVHRALADEGEGHASMAGFIRHIGQQITIVLGERLRAAGLDSGAAEPWAFGIVGMVHLAGDWWSERRTMPRERLVAYLTDLLWNGMSGVGAAESRRASGAGTVVPLRSERA